MIWYGLLVTIFAIMCVLMVLIILMQKGKSSMGFGSLGGGTQLLFGGSGGQDLFQKVTWIMGVLFMAGSLILAILKRPAQSRVLGTIEQQQQPTVPVPSAQPSTTQPSAE